MYGRSNFSWRGTAGRGVCGLFAFEGEADLFPLISDNPPRELCTWD